MRHYTHQITTVTAHRIEAAPETVQARRVRAEVLLGTGRVTFAALAAAWYGGDVAAARAELYPFTARAVRATVAPWEAWDGT